MFGGHMQVKNEQLGIDGELKVLDTRAPEGTAQDVSVMGMEAAVDSKPQQLKIIRPFVQSIKNIPKTIPPEAQIVLQALLACFEKQKNVQEGLVKDLVWGFAQSGIPDACTLLGIRQLENLGYVKIQAPDNTIIRIESPHIAESWVRYEPKLLELVYDC
jgi:hypothetical protein